MCQNCNHAGPSGSRQFAKVCDILEQYQRDPSKLIPILHRVQEEYRYLPEDVLTFVATSLGLPPAHVFGVATFYTHFTLQPRGKYTIRLCDGTACHVRGSMAILEALYKRLNLSNTQHTTPDLLFTVETVSCLGGFAVWRRSWSSTTTSTGRYRRNGRSPWSTRSLHARRFIPRRR